MKKSLFGTTKALSIELGEKKVTVDTGHKYKYKCKYRVIWVKNEYDMLQE